MNRKHSIVLVAVFLFGLIAGHGLSLGASDAFSTPSYDDGYEFPAQLYTGLTGRAIERPSPSDTITERDIEVYQDKVIIGVQDAIYAKFTNTNSMDPVLDAGANAIEIRPTSPDDVQEGDIIAYRNCRGDGTIIHRVIKQGEDQLGTYYIVKGDNNPRADPCLVRFGDIKGKVVVIIY